jgi:YfiR/HmsC-like
MEKRRKKRVRCTCGLVVWFVLLALACASAGAQADSRAEEYTVKAAFLFHFAQFVEWPEGTFQYAKSPLVYCTVGEDPFQGALEASLRGKAIGPHSLQVRHLKDSSEAQGCHVVFLGKAKRRVPEELAILQGNPILTVGESEQFVKDSGMIGFCIEENKIRFNINLEAAEKANLKISARLLMLAKTVIGRPKRD